MIISLIILLLMTILGVTSMSSSIMEERMSGNSVDRQLAFQAAEAALAQRRGLCTGPEPAGARTRTAPAASAPTRATKPTLPGAPTPITPPGTLPSNLRRPMFLVAGALRPTPSTLLKTAARTRPRTPASLTAQRLFRITAIGYGGSATARVMLEASFITDNRYGTGSNCACGDPTYCTSVRPNITCTP